MQRQCPDCLGHKVFPGQFNFMGAKITAICRTCGGTGIVYSKRPGKVGYSQRRVKRAKTPSYIKAQRDAAK